MQRAVDNRGRHLNALMALYSIEFLFVTGAIVDERFIKPPAAFDS
jgi:hypothetical protein